MEDDIKMWPRTNSLSCLLTAFSQLAKSNPILDHFHLLYSSTNLIANGKIS